ncbi:hypothetical protein BXZ70DRAFT_1067621 [Cristinia sonorae]|uniref:F-box domain-containing protein n=1 Tax=Cristinia sonorae TaxID=1940300 RepID=A0A8K0UID9_9AGAR|nr:hypothetical protein BXZ70DRAFT_1067621 [Cristinia sonorae]
MSESLEDVAVPSTDSNVTVTSARSFSSSGLKLPFDVLFQVAQHICPAPTLCSFMLTCRTVYHGSALLLLRGKISVAKTLPKLVSFCRFMRRENSRALHLRDLRIDTTRWRYRDFDDTTIRVLDRLADVISRAKRIEVLEIQHSEQLLFHSSRLAHAVSSLTKLKTITLTGVGLCTQAACMELKSPVTSASLTYMDVDEMGLPLSTAIENVDPTELLKNFQETLEELSVTCHTDDGFAQTFLRTPFLHVKELSLETGASILDQYPFMVAFPNVSEFSWSEEFDWGFADIQGAHDDNIALTGELWPELSLLDAGIHCCFVSGLQSRVQEWCVGLLDQTNFGQFYEVMGLLRPSVIQLFMGAAMVQKTDALFPPSDVKRVALSVDLDELIGEPTKAQHVVEALPRHLQVMPLRELILVFRHRLPTMSEGYPPSYDTSKSDPDSEEFDEYFSFRQVESFTHSDPIRDYFDNTATLVMTAQTLANAIPTLEKIYIAADFRYLKLSAKIVRDEEGIAEFHALSQEEEDSILDGIEHYVLWSIRYRSPPSQI